MINCYLGIDAGGTSTRAAVTLADGTCVGTGHAGSGNPISSGTQHAATQVVLAAQEALANADLTPQHLIGGVAAMAGSRVERDAEWLHAPLRAAGVAITMKFEADLLATFLSATPQPDGYALVAGTGAVAIRVRNFDVEAVADGIGWLLGDGGSGFWMGQQAVRAAFADLDGRAEPTALTAAIFHELGLSPSAASAFQGRPAAVQQAVGLIYTWRPVELARFAPIVFDAAQHGDQIACEIVSRAGRALRRTLLATVVPDIPGPLVLGGSALTKQPRFAETVASALPGQTPLTTTDGLVGAVNLALRRHDIEVTKQTFDRLTETVNALRQ